LKEPLNAHHAVHPVNSGHAIRESIEAREVQLLHPLAALSARSQGRHLPEPPCPIRTAFQRDRDRILHSKAFRRLKHKTQVFISPAGDHFRTRLTHTLEVAQVSRTIARALNLNEDLTEAIALGHDLGHPPFGHNGEEILNELYPGGFRHELQSVRIAQVLEPLNLSLEVLEGMEAQTNTLIPKTLEAHVVKIADRMTYLHHDVEDAIRAGLMAEADLPAQIRQVLGNTRQIRLDTLVMDLIHQSEARLSAGEATLALSAEKNEAMGALRKWMFKHIYLSPRQLEQKKKVRRILSGLFDFFGMQPDALGRHFAEGDGGTEGDPARRIVDYIAGMTDRYAVQTYNRHLLPTPYSHPDCDLWLEEGLAHR
jgi:dGTPase